MNSILDQCKRSNDIAQQVQKLAFTPQKPSMSSKLNRVAELFELDVLSEEEALKACKVIIGQHAKVRGRAENGEKAD